MADATPGIPTGPLDGIFLDFYGTVAGGDRHAVERICQAVIDDHRLTLSASALAVLWGKAYFSAIEAVDGHAFRTLLQIERDTLIETVAPLAGPIDPVDYIRSLNDYLAAPPIFDEVREVLAQVRLPICIVSNADERELRAALEHLGLRFHDVVTSEAARSYKPERRIFEYALERTGWSPDRVIHVGDSLHSDVGGARRAGIRAAWVHRRGRISDVGTDLPDLTWHDLYPLVGLSAE